MDLKDETYRQRSFLQTGAPFFGAALVFLIAAFGLCLGRDTLFPAVLLLVTGLLLLIPGIRSVKGESRHIRRFVRERSVFFHRCDPPLTMTGLLDDLKQEGFDVMEYPFGNYHCYRDIGHRCSCHFFVANNDTPDCPEAESYSKLFIRTVCEAGMSMGAQYVLDLEYGPGLEQRSPEYIQAAREGFMQDKQGVFFGFRLACDTRDDILYCADGVTRIIWHKSEAPAIYVSELLNRLFFESGRQHTEVREADKEEEGTR